MASPGCGDPLGMQGEGKESGSVMNMSPQRRIPEPSGPWLSCTAVASSDPGYPLYKDFRSPTLSVLQRREAPGLTVKMTVQEREQRQSHNSEVAG